MISSSHRRVVRMRDVADAAGVSCSLVSAILSRGGRHGAIRFHPATADRVMRVAAQLNYRPDFTAQTLAGKESRLIAVLLDTAITSFGSRIFCEFERLASLNSYRLLVGQAHENAGNFSSLLKDFQSFHPAAVVAFAHAYPECNFDLYGHLKDFDNVILFGRPFHSAVKFPAVDVDWESGYYRLTRRLLEAGYSRPALFVSYPYYSEMMVRGYRRALEETVMGFRDIHEIRMERSPFSETDLGRIVDRLEMLRSDVFLCSDQLALRIMGEMQKRGRRIPEDLALVGRNNDFFGAFLNPGLTTIALPPETAAEKMYQMMEACRDGKELSSSLVLLEPEIIVRGSAPALCPSKSLTGSACTAS